MDSPSKFFFSLEKRNSRLIHGLQSETGQLLTQPAAIRQRAVNFYSQLYTSRYEEDHVLFDSFCSHLSQLPHQLNLEVDGPLHPEELCTALQSMEAGRAPGIDGPPVEFYKTFWTELNKDRLLCAWL